MNSEKEIDISEYDHYVYIGAINRIGYQKLTKEIENREIRKNKVMLFLTTSGGDPDAGYRIGRALQHYYAENVSIFIPSYCKSAGTLTAISANYLYIGNHGELGPLDIQLLKMDELGARSSGLDIFKTLEQLENRIGPAFVRALSDIRESTGISTKMAADMASNLVHSIFSPIASQIDPLKMGEHQRATAVAMEYGQRLNALSKNLKNETNINKLISQYPSHSFVIDRKEATEIFKNVSKPDISLIEEYAIICENIINTPSVIGLTSPIIWHHQLKIEQEGQENERGVTGEAETGGNTTIDDRNSNEINEGAKPKRNRRNETA